MFCSRVENLDLKLGKFLSLLIYTILAEIPGVAREIKKPILKKPEFFKEKLFLKRCLQKNILISLCCPKSTHGMPQTIRSSRLASFS